MEHTIIDAERGTPLSTAMDATGMAAIFARQLAGTGVTVVACTIARYRHRPGQRCLVQYGVRVRERSGAERVERITGQWHHEPGYTAGLHRRLAHRAARAGASWTRPFAPTFFDEGSGMLATTFPWDRRLPGLPAVAGGQSPAVLAPMLTWMGTSGERLEHVAVEPIRYREQLNAVCRYTVRARFAAGAWHASTFYAKVYPTDEGARAAALLAALAAATPAGVGTARVQPPVAYVQPLRTLVLAAAPGTDLGHRSRHRRDTVVADLSLTATALARFGARDANLPAGRRAAADDGHRAIRALAAALPEHGGVLSSLEAWMTAPREASALGLTHGDLKLEHVFIDRGDVWLIDMDSAHRGEPAWDLALLQARWWAAHDTADVDAPHRDLGTELLARTYLAGVPAAWATRLPQLRARALLDVAAGIVKRCEPEAVARAGRLVHQAQVVAGVRR